MYIKFIFTLIILVLFLGGIFTVAATGLWQVPILSALLTVDKPINLGVASDPVFLQNWIQKNGLNLVGQVTDCRLGCRISYRDVKKQRLIMFSEEISSYLNTLYAGALPISDIQVKLGDGNFAEASVWADLSDYGYEVNAPIYLKGKVEQIDGRAIDIEIKSAKIGLLPLPGEYYDQAEAALEKIFTDEVADVSGYRLDSVDITDGQLSVTGQLPQTIVVE